MTESSSVGRSSKSPSPVLREVEEFREGLIDYLRGIESEVEEDIHERNMFEHIRIFSRLSGFPRKAIQVVAAAEHLREDKTNIDNLLTSDEVSQLETYESTVSSRSDRFFPEGDAAYYSGSDTLVVHRMPEDILQSQDISQDLYELLRPLFDYMFVESTDMKDLRDAFAHEGTHSWLTKNSKKTAVESNETIRAAEESFCYFSGWTESGIYIESDHLVESKTPQKDKVVWASQLLIEKAEKEGRGLEWARRAAASMYNKASTGENPFLFIFNTCLTEGEKELLRRYQDSVENLGPVFDSFSDLVRSVEEESLSMGEKISFNRAKQIESDVNWDEPHQAVRQFEEELFRRSLRKKYGHAKIESLIEELAHEEAEKLAEYSNMIENLEKYIESKQLLNEARSIEKGLSNTARSINPAD